uniref:Pectinesterase inhibitor domain-containing protein n=1 Tax=Oryza meridionalis TaxID=40149 RepID=A0A0E0DA58_9ORYZ
MGKVIALILVVIAVECTNKMATRAAPCDNFAANLEDFKAALYGPAEECSASVERCISVTKSHILKALKEVEDAAPPEKKLETQEATFEQAKIAVSTLDKAKATVSETKLLRFPLPTGWLLMRFL